MVERIKKLRKALDLTQQEFANRIGMKQNTIATYEMGRAIPSDPTINNICKEFNVNEKWLRNGIEPMFVEISRDDEISDFINKILSQESSSFKHRLISLLSRLSEQDWEILERIARDLAVNNTATTDAEFAEETSPEIASIRELSPVIVKEPKEDIERQADEFAEIARKQFILEKKRELQASSVKGSGAV